MISLLDTVKGFIVSVNVSVISTAQLAHVSIGTVTKLTSAFQFMGKTLKRVRSHRAER